ncbi:copia protein [Tanacetum coccineum]|uniref:Copia protein n=1 Tax=Tanacetum coccineum TaxID=301880 RepID=A0ABQ4XDC7_9ASTR
MDPYNHSTPTSIKLLILDTRKFEQWKFRIQQYLQHEHYALWEVIEFGDSYKAPPEETGKGVTGEGSAKKKGRTVAITTEDMQKRRNDVKARTTLLLALPDEHQLRFSKYDNAKELWEAILKTFGGNEATKKTKKNQLKQQYGNFKAEGSETLEQTFNRLQAIVSHLEFMDVPIEQDDLNQKFLSSLAPEWLVYTIVWRNRDDLDTMSLDDVYNHLKVYEPEVQKSAGSNSQNMAFISSSNTNSGKSEVSTVQGVSTSGVQVSTASTDVAAASLSHDTVCAYIATQPNGSQIKYEDITQIDDDDIEEMDIKWNLALLSMRADRFWKKTGKKITIQGSNVAGFDKSKVKCFNCHKMGHFARECRAPRSQDKGRRESYKKDPKVEEPTPKAMIAIDGIGWDWSYMADEDENHALVANEEEVPTEYALMAKSSSSSDNELNEELSDCETDLYNYKRGLSQVKARLVVFKNNEIKLCERIRVLERDIELKDNKIENLRIELEELKKEKDSIDIKIKKFENSAKDLDCLLGTQRSVKDKTGLGLNEYTAVPPPPVQVYSPPKNDRSLDKMYKNTSQSPKVMSNNFSALIIKEWDSEDESEVNSTLNETVRSSFEQEKFDKFTKEEQEQGELTIEEKLKLFMELLNERKRHFAKLRAEEKRRKPLTKGQRRNQMCTYLKNMGGFTHIQLKNKSYEEIQKAFDKIMGWINNFKPMDSEEVKSSEKKAEGNRKISIGKKRARNKHKQESSKRQRMKDDKETGKHEEAEEDDEAEMKKHMEIVQDKEEIAIDVIPLATKPLMIIEYKIVKEGHKGFYHLIRVDGSSKWYSSMIKMLQNIDREDLETLWKLVKAKHGNTRSEDDYERVFWGDLKVMFKPDIKSEVWRSLQGYKVTVWKLFDSCGVHFVRFKDLHIFMLVEKRYPLTPITITNMLNKKLQADHWNEMCYQLLKLMTKQKKGQ